MYIYATMADSHHKGRSLVNLDRANGVHVHQLSDHRFSVIAVNDMRESHQLFTTIALTSTLEEATEIVDQIARAMKSGKTIFDLGAPAD